jgi:uncharacterized membrane protein YhhN
MPQAGILRPRWNSMGTTAAIIVCGLAVGGLLLAEYRGSQRGKFLAKPLASAAFIAVALSAGALQTAYGQWILLGLVLCLAGDVLLIPEGKASVFRAGIFAFLLGHLAYAAAFMTRPRSAFWLVLAAAAIVAVLLVVWQWLRARLPADMRLPVQAYFVVIGAMTVLACSVTGAGGPATIAAGAIAFTASDISVARDRFVHAGFFNRAWGLPLYYLAQVLLASSTAAVA